MVFHNSLSDKKCLSLLYLIIVSDSMQVCSVLYKSKRILITVSSSSSMLRSQTHNTSMFLLHLKVL